MSDLLQDATARIGSRVVELEPEREPRWRDGCLLSVLIATATWAIILGLTAWVVS